MGAPVNIVNHHRNYDSSPQGQKGSEPQQDCEFLRALRKIKTRLSALLPICSVYGIGVSNLVVKVILDS